MALVEVDGVPTPGLDSALSQLSKGRRPTTLGFEMDEEEDGGQEAADVTVLAVEAGAPG